MQWSHCNLWHGAEVFKLVWAWVPFPVTLEYLNNMVLLLTLLTTVTNITRVTCHFLNHGWRGTDSTLFITLPPYYAEVMTLDAQLQKNVCSCKSILPHWASHSRWYLESLRGLPQRKYDGSWANSSLYCLGPCLALLWTLCGNSATMRDNFCCCTLLQPKV